MIFVYLATLPYPSPRFHEGRLGGDMVLGYRKSEHFDNPDKDYGVNLNPVKSAKVTFSTGDKVIVLAED